MGDATHDYAGPEGSETCCCDWAMNVIHAECPVHTEPFWIFGAEGTDRLYYRVFVSINEMIPGAMPAPLFVRIAYPN